MIRSKLLILSKPYEHIYYILEDDFIGHKNKKSLTKQIQDTLESKLRIGESKYEAKKEGVHTQYIYSYTTLKNYMRHCNYFAKFCKENYGCKTLAQCRPYIKEYMETRKDTFVL